MGIALGAAVVLAVAAVVAVDRLGGSGDGGGDGEQSTGDRRSGPTEGGGWVSSLGGNSRLLATDGELVCSTALPATLYCLDVATGEERLTQELDEGVVTSPVLLEDRVLVGSARALSGHLVAYSREGEELWEARVAVTAERDIPLAGGVVALVDGRELVGLDVATGEERWKLYPEGETEDPQATGSEIFTDGTRFYGAFEQVNLETGESVGHIVGIDPASGAEQWRSPPFPELAHGAGIAAAAPFSDGSAVAFRLPGEPGRVVVLDPASGALRWEVPLETSDVSVAHLAGTTFVADGEDMRAYDTNGVEEWVVPAPIVSRNPELTPGELVVAQDRLFAVGFDVFEVNPSTGATAVVRENVSATDVAVTGDHLLVAGINQLEAVPLSSVRTP